MDALLLTPVEAARALGIGRTKVYELTRPVGCDRSGSTGAGGFPGTSWRRSSPGSPRTRHDQAVQRRGEHLETGRRPLVRRVLRPRVVMEIVGHSTLE
jgi:hypothetical protein